MNDCRKMINSHSSPCGKKRKEVCIVLSRTAPSPVGSENRPNQINKTHTHDRMNEQVGRELAGGTFYTTAFHPKYNTIRGSIEERKKKPLSTLTKTPSTDCFFIETLSRAQSFFSRDRIGWDHIA